MRNLQPIDPFLMNNPATNVPINFAVEIVMKLEAQINHQLKF